MSIHNAWIYFPLNLTFLRLSTVSLALTRRICSSSSTFSNNETCFLSSSNCEMVDIALAIQKSPSEATAWVFNNLSPGTGISPQYESHGRSKTHPTLWCWFDYLDQPNSSIIVNDSFDEGHLRMLEGKCYVAKNSMSCIYNFGKERVIDIPRGKDS